MNRRVIWLLVAAFLFSSGFGGPAPKTPGHVDGNRKAQPGEMAFPTEMPIDNFEDQNTSTNPEWWSFDKITLNVVPTGRLVEGDENVRATVGGYALNLRGESTDWYVGGLGTYFARSRVDLSFLKKLELDVYGIGENTGTLKFELADDDNGNYKFEYDENWIPLFDDRWTFELPIDWKGWKHVEILFSEFRVDNPGRGNGIWDIEQMDGSGGLLQMQIIAISRGREGAINPTMDNLKLSK